MKKTKFGWSKIKFFFSKKWREFTDFLIILFSRDPAKVQWKIIERLQRQYKNLIFPDDYVENNMKQSVLNQKKALLSEAGAIINRKLANSESSTVDKQEGCDKAEQARNLAFEMQIKRMVGSSDTALNEMSDKLKGFDDKTFGAFRRAIARAENLENAVDVEAEEEVHAKMHDAANKMAAMSQNPEDSPEEEIIVLDIHINGKWCTSCIAENNNHSISTITNELVIPFLNNREIKREIYFPSTKVVNFIVG